MPSENKTPNYGLNQWQGNEYFKRQDFVDDNAKIDTALKELAENDETVADAIAQGKEQGTALALAVSEMHSLAEGAVPKSSIGAPNGVASLDADGKLAAAQRPTHSTTHKTGGADALEPSDIGAATRLSGTATLALASWTGTAAPYTYVLTIPGILATDTPHVDRVTGTDSAAAALINTAWGLIAGYHVKPQTSADTITFYATAKPVVAIPIMWEVTRS